MDTEHCECCKKELQTNGLQNQDDSMVVARVIPDEGFVADNLAILCNKCNRIKNTGDIRRIEIVANWVKGQEDMLNSGHQSMY
jgi:hypothetical protein